MQISWKMRLARIRALAFLRSYYRRKPDKDSTPPRGRAVVETKIGDNKYSEGKGGKGVRVMRLRSAQRVDESGTGRWKTRERKKGGEVKAIKLEKSIKTASGGEQGWGSVCVWERGKARDKKERENRRGAPLISRRALPACIRLARLKS